MQINPIQLKDDNQFINDYRNHEDRVMKHFDYSPYYDYKQRVQDLQKRTFNRIQLTDLLYTVNKRWDAPASTIHNIERLENEDSVVVIGGQQAGLMTGPMYTVNKIISIIQFARQQEEELKVPVIPIFWMAGEDHDYEEINHVFLMEEEKMKKHQLRQPVNEKQSITDIPIDRSYAGEWLDGLFTQLNETQHTKDLYMIMKDCLDQSHTYVDFFAKVTFQLFKEEGLVLIDSGSSELRQLESDFFVKMIRNQPTISEGVYQSFQQLTQSGYPISLDVDLHDAHLFILENNERILLVRDELGQWTGKQNEVSYTTEELLQIAIETPELLSNNVVTRPVMQELLFPTLSFIGGLGEISYWAVLKPVFRAFDIKMPPVLPRLSFTYIHQQLEAKISKLAINLEEAVTLGVEENKGNWLKNQQSPPINQMSAQLKEAISKVHRPFRGVAKDIRADLGDLADKNLEYLIHQIDFLESRMNQVLEEKFEVKLAEFDFINQSLHPHNGLQERVWNPLQLLNTHGIDFFQGMTDESCSFKEEHFCVYI